MVKQQYIHVHVMLNAPWRYCFICINTCVYIFTYLFDRKSKKKIKGNIRKDEFHECDDTALDQGEQIGRFYYFGQPFQITESDEILRYFLHGKKWCSSFDKE
jgi:hypothetical protein